MSFVIVWRLSEGAAVQTYAHEDKSPQVFDSEGAIEAQDAQAVDEASLASLLRDRNAFDPVRVDTGIARELLGWTV